MSTTDSPKDPQEMPVKPKPFEFALPSHTLAVIEVGAGTYSLVVVPIYG